ncbi:MAG: family 43 glycosylhydrolase, partial [Phycisphaerae bacterium]
GGMLTLWRCVSMRRRSMPTRTGWACHPFFPSPPRRDGSNGARSAPQLPPIEPLFDYPVRDTSVCVGGDGAYYLTGTTGYPTWWKTNEGIRVWKSADLKTWQLLGLVWTIERDGTWQKAFHGENRAIWAPEIHFLKGTFWLTYCVNYGGTGILRSTTGKPEGPYADVNPDGPLTGEIDASLFQDDDGAVYFVYQDGKIARMKDDMTGLAEAPRLLKPANAGHVGFEGAFIFKAGGRYYLSCAEFDDREYYNCMIAGSDKLLGPYGDRYLAVPHGGHNMFFKDRDGRWWSTFFGNDPAAPFRERARRFPLVHPAASGLRGREPRARLPRRKDPPTGHRTVGPAGPLASADQRDVQGPDRPGPGPDTRKARRRRAGFAQDVPQRRGGLQGPRRLLLGGVCERIPGSRKGLTP